MTFSLRRSGKEPRLRLPNSRFVDFSRILSKDEIAAMVSHKNPSTRRLLAYHCQPLPPDIIKWLAADKEASVRYAIANSNHGLDTESALKLAKDEDPEVRRCLARRAQPLPEEVVSMLLSDTDQYVHQIMTKRQPRSESIVNAIFEAGTRMNLLYGKPPYRVFGCFKKTQIDDFNSRLLPSMHKAYYTDVSSGPLFLALKNEKFLAACQPGYGIPWIVDDKSKSDRLGEQEEAFLYTVIRPHSSGVPLLQQGMDRGIGNYFDPDVDLAKEHSDAVKADDEAQDDEDRNLDALLSNPDTTQFERKRLLRRRKEIVKRFLRKAESITNSIFESYGPDDWAIIGEGDCSMPLYPSTIHSIFGDLRTYFGGLNLFGGQLCFKLA